MRKLDDKTKTGPRTRILTLTFSALLGLVVLGASSVLGGAPAFAQGDFSGVEIKATHVAGSVWMLEGRGGNIGVSAGPDGILIVDDQFAPLAEKIRGALTKLDKGDLEFVLNTHWHGDHTGGNIEFGREAPIIAHANVRKRLAEGMNLGSRVTPPAPAEALPVVTFDEGLSLHFNGEEIRVVHTPPAHTDGDSVIWFTGSNVVHMGDNFFVGRFPFVDIDSGGDVEGLERAVGSVMKALPAGAKIIPGHGGLSDAKGLAAYHEMIVESLALVRSKIAAGKTLDEIRQEGVPEKYADWGSGFISTDRWIEIVHRSLSK